MKDNPDSFWSDRDVVAVKAEQNSDIAVYDFRRVFMGTKNYKDCKLKDIPARYLMYMLSTLPHNQSFRYFKSQLGFPLRKDLEFNELINYTLLKMKDGGIHNSILERYEGLVELKQCGKREKGSSLGFEETIFFFLVFITGLLFSNFILAVELLWCFFQDKRGQPDAAQILVN